MPVSNPCRAEQFAIPGSRSHSAFASPSNSSVRPLSCVGDRRRVSKTGSSSKSAFFMATHPPLVLVLWARMVNKPKEGVEPGGEGFLNCHVSNSNGPPYVGEHSRLRPHSDNPRWFPARAFQRRGGGWTAAIGGHHNQAAVRPVASSKVTDRHLASISRTCAAPYHVPRPSGYAVTELVLSNPSTSRRLSGPTWPSSSSRHN